MVKTVYQALSDYVAASATAISPLRFFAFEGDSRTTPTAFPSMWTPNPQALGVSYAVSGSGMSHLNSRIAEIQKVPQVKVAGQLFVAVVGPMGANDLHTTAGATDEIAAATYAGIVATYCDAMYTAGFDHVVLCTELPIAQATSHDARRAILNEIYRNDYPGATPVTICDFAADPIMGPDGSFSTNPSYWTDELHPNATGNAQLGTVLEPVLNGLT